MFDRCGPLALCRRRPVALVSLCSTSPSAPPRSGPCRSIAAPSLLVQRLVVLLRLVRVLQRGQALAPVLVDNELSAVDLLVGVLGILPFVVRQCLDATGGLLV